MPDPLDPQAVGSIPPPPPEREVNASTIDLPSNIAAALACIPLIGGIIFYILEKRDGFVRFYAMQSIIFGGAWFLFWILHSSAFAILTPIPAIGLVFRMVLWLIWLVVGLAFLVLWVVSTVKAFTGVRWEMPYIGPIARKQTDAQTVL
jgi:uncharacterized membrane protein